MDGMALNLKCYRGLIKIQLDLDPIIRLRGIRRWAKLNKMEKVVMRAERDFEIAKMRLQVGAH